MRIAVSQIYVEAGCSYPFNFRFQRYLTSELSRLVNEGEEWLAQYGHDWAVIVRVSAKSELDRPEIKGPTVFKKKKEVEYTIFLPYPKGASVTDVILRDTLEMLIDSIIHVLVKLGLQADGVLKLKSEVTNRILSDDSMIDSH